MTFAQECAAMLTDCTEQLGESVTYRRRVAGTRDAATGKMTPIASVDTTITAVRGGSQSGFIPGADGPVEMLEWVIRAADLSNDPQAGDTIISGSETHIVVMAQKQSAGAAWSVRTRT